MRGDEIWKSDFSWGFLTEDLLTINNQTSQIFVWFFFLVKCYLRRKHTRTNEIFFFSSATSASGRIVGQTKSWRTLIWTSKNLQETLSFARHLIREENFLLNSVLLNFEFVCKGIAVITPWFIGIHLLGLLPVAAVYSRAVCLFACWFIRNSSQTLPGCYGANYFPLLLIPHFLQI